MNLSKQRAHFIATAALCVLVAALGIGVVAQQLTSSRLSGDIRAQKQALGKSRQELKDRAKWRNDYSDLSLKLGGRMSTCTWSDQMPFMVAQVTGIVDANGLKVESLQPEPMTSNGSIQRFPMRLGFQTDLQHLTGILKDMRNSVPIMDVERLEVRNAQGESGGKLQINMTVASFVVLDKNSPVARRRAVIPVKDKEEAKDEAKSGSKSEAKAEAESEAKPQTGPQAKQSDRPVRKPEAKPSSPGPKVAKPERPAERPNGSDRKRPEKAESPHKERPEREKADKPARTETKSEGKSEGKAADTPVRVEMRVKSVEAAPNGGPR